jgi:glycyl-tRNA synthetase beta chain
MIDSHPDLLVELGCEELPPKTLRRLAEAFYSGVCKGLSAAGFDIDPGAGSVLYTPRRMGFRLANVAGKQADQVLERKGPAVSAAFDADGNPTQAALGFARSVGKKPEELERQKTDKGEWLFCSIRQEGKNLQDVLFPVLEKALSTLPVAKPMRWSDHDFSFVRPVHWLVVLHGNEVLEGSLFGKNAGRATLGHRIHAPGPHNINSVSDYESLLKSAFVIVDPESRKQKIKQLAIEAGNSLGGKTRITDDLLDEVSNIVEWPVAVSCNFDEVFLEVPSEALIASMEDHQKFFPVLDADNGDLTPGFIVISNIESSDTPVVKQGYERVIRPRLADAQFFWDQDQKQGLESYFEGLRTVVFQKKLGSIGDKSKRIGSISEKLAEVMQLNPEPVIRSALLCKCDLLTDMVGEFPELQGTMGAYYAESSGEPDEVSRAIAEHYSPRYSGDSIPSTVAGQILSIADRMDSLVGIFSAGLKPTGNKDPFALRRGALGVVRILEEATLNIPLDHLLEISAQTVSAQIEVSEECLADVRSFMLDRLRHYYLDKGFDTNVVNAVFAAPLSTIPDLSARLKALAGFMELEEAESLVAANKRIGNILRKSEITVSQEIDEDILKIDEERMLFDEISRMETVLSEQFSSGDYASALTSLAGLDPVISGFFDSVMVMDEDLKVRNNRLSLLARMKGLFDHVADLAMAT